jgi:hypothetical protein
MICGGEWSMVRRNVLSKIVEVASHSYRPERDSFDPMSVVKKPQGLAIFGAFSFST